MFVAVVVFGLLVFWQASKLCSLWSRKRNRQSQSNERLEMHIGIDVSSSQAAGIHASQGVFCSNTLGSFQQGLSAQTVLLDKIALL